MSDWRPNADNSDSEEEETTFDIRGCEAIIFVLDAFLYETPTHFQNAIKLLRDALLSGLMVKDKDLIGIVFANTKESPPPKEVETVKNIVVPANCTLFLPLRQLNKDIVEYFLNFAEDNISFDTTYGVSQCKFANMIRLCGNMFQQCGIKLSNQTIIYFTDRDMPHDTGTIEFQKAIQKASDMEGQNIEFNLIPMRDDFDYEPFYKEFISLTKDIDMESFEPTDPKLAREMIADRKLKLDINKRCLGHVNWNLGNNLDVSVKFYNYFQKSVYPQKLNLQRDDNSIVTAKITNYIDEKDSETGDIINRREMRYGDEIHYELSCGNESIQLSANEMKKIVYPYQPVLQLLGFKDRTAVKKEHFLRPCSFVYPDEGRIVGSTKLFTALWMRCLEKEKIAVCAFVPRQKSKPAYVALVPVTAGDRDESNAPTFMNGDGFKVVYLPLADDMHHYDFKEWGVQVSPSDEGQAIFKKIAKKLKVKYIPPNIKDPALEELQSKLLALAFNIVTEGGGDIQMPNPLKQDNRIEQYFEEFESVFGIEEVTEKRKATVALTAGSPAKKLKITDQDLTAAGIDDLIATSRLDSLNKEQMSNFLKQNDVKVTKTMTKAVLTQKIMELRRT